MGISISPTKSFAFGGGSEDSPAHTKVFPPMFGCEWPFTHPRAVQAMTSECRESMQSKQRQKQAIHPLEDIQIYR